MFSRSLLACAVCAVTVGCDRGDKTRSAMEMRMEADTVTRAVDSLAFGGESPRAVTESPMADTGGKIASASLADLSVRGIIDTATGSKPKPIPMETPPRGKTR